MGAPLTIYELAQSLVSAAQEGLRRERGLVEDLRRIKTSSDRMRAAIESESLKREVAIAYSDLMDPRDGLDESGIKHDRPDGLREHVDEMHRRHKKLADEVSKVIDAAKDPAP